MRKELEACLAGQCDLQIMGLTEINLHQYLICKGNTLKDRTEGPKILLCFILTKKTPAILAKQKAGTKLRGHILSSVSRDRDISICLHLLVGIYTIIILNHVPTSLSVKLAKGDCIQS